MAHVDFPPHLSTICLDTENMDDCRLLFFVRIKKRTERDNTLTFLKKNH